MSCMIFHRKKHISFFERILNGLPGTYASQETNLMTIIYFCVSGLDVLGAKEVIDKHRTKLIDFIYSLTSKSFPGGFVGNVNDAQCDLESSKFFIGPSIAMTYAALNSLVILRDDLSKCNKYGIIQMLQVLQTRYGSFSGVVEIHKNSGCIVGSEESESDMRFVYCACVISFILKNWTGIDIPKILSFIWRSQTYEGGFAQVPGAESHGGSTYCAVASLFLVYRAHKDHSLEFRDQEHYMKTKCLFEPSSHINRFCPRDSILRWCVLRQLRGFAGRPNKPEDSCYSFWIGATLKLLDGYKFVDKNGLQEFCLETQDSIVGGFSKWPDTRSDPLHSYLCIAGLSLTQACTQSMENSLNEYESDPQNLDFEPLNPVFPALNITEAAHQHLLKMHSSENA